MVRQGLGIPTGHETMLTDRASSKSENGSKFWNIYDDKVGLNVFGCQADISGTGISMYASCIYTYKERCRQTDQLRETET